MISLGQLHVAQCCHQTSGRVTRHVTWGWCVEVLGWLEIRGEVERLRALRTRITVWDETANENVPFLVEETKVLASIAKGMDA